MQTLNSNRTVRHGFSVGYSSIRIGENLFSDLKISFPHTCMHILWWSCPTVGTVGCGIEAQTERSTGHSSRRMSIATLKDRRDGWLYEKGTKLVLGASAQHRICRWRLWEWQQTKRSLWRGEEEEERRKKNVASHVNSTLGFMGFLHSLALFLLLLLLKGDFYRCASFCFKLGTLV